MELLEKIQKGNLDINKILDELVNLTLTEPICLVNIRIRINKNTFNVKWKNGKIDYSATFDKKSFEKEKK